MADGIRLIDRAAALYGYIVAGVNTLSAIFGRKTTDEDGKTAKAASGFFGLRDERVFYELLVSFSADEKDRWILLQFLKFLFPRVTPEEKLIRWYYGNRFRVYLTQMDEVLAKILLNDIVKRIKVHGKNKKGYAKVREELLDQGIPIPSKDVAKSLGKARTALTDVLKKGGPAAVKATKAVGAEAVRLAQWVQATVPPAIAQARMDAETRLNNLRSQPPESVFERILRWVY